MIAEQGWVLPESPLSPEASIATRHCAGSSPPVRDGRGLPPPPFPVCYPLVDALTYAMEVPEQFTEYLRALAKGGAPPALDGSGDATQQEWAGLLTTLGRQLADQSEELARFESRLASEMSGHKETERALRQAQKMEAIARLAGGVAHDFNNLLTSILGFGALVQRQLPEDHMAYEDVKEIIEAGERARDLTQQLLALGRRTQMRREVIDVNQIIDGMAQILARTIGEDIALEVELAPGMECIVADTGSLEQVIMNLAVNARDAMPKGGSLVLRSEQREVDAAAAAAVAELLPGEYIVITVKDTGEGMSPEIQEHIFEPFFTTKTAGKGSGLGLSTVYGIVKQFGGTIEIASAIAEGTDVRVYLPAVRAARQAHETELKAPVEGGEETVLLVEDEASVRRLTVRMLRELGYTVLEAENGLEALNRSRGYDGDIDLVLSDVVMPQMSGPEMVAQLGLERDGFATLFISGFTQDRHLTQADGREAALLLKPFTRDVLARKVRSVLEKRAG